MKLDNCLSKRLYLVAVVSGTLLAGSAIAGEQTAATIPHRVVAIYFHRTQRCPTCKKISAYIEEAISSAFAKQIKNGHVSLHMIDFQDPQNKKYTQYYSITGPTLVIVDVHDGKPAQWQPMPKVWSLVFEKEAFFQYVQNGICRYLEERR